LLSKQVTSSKNSARLRSGRPAARGIGLLQRTQRRDLILLTGVLALACVSVLTIGFLVLRFQPELGPASSTPAAPAAVPGPQPTHTVMFEQVTGLNQFVAAKTAAQSWAADAELVSANAAWPKIVGQAQVGEPTLWTYRFYSPAKNRLFFVNVDPDGQVQTIEHIAPVTLPPRVIPADSWAIDSSAALALWLDNGGATILGNNPGLEMLIQLRSSSDGATPVWLVVGLNTQTEAMHTVIIDASQGIVTATEPGS
jgi:hypothetical protein